MVATVLAVVMGILAAYVVIKDGVPEEPECSPSYDLCFRPEPDLDCSEIEERDFRARAPDPHAFDHDGDGIGCE